MSQIGISESAEEKQIPKAISRLDTILSELEKAIGVCYEGLQPILRDERRVESEIKDNLPEQAPLASIINGFADRIDNLNDILGNIRLLSEL